MQPQPNPASAPLRRRLVVGLAVAYAAAGGIHLAVGAQHLGIDRRHAAFFLLVGAWQLGWGILTRRRASPATHLLGAGGTLGLVAVWAISRTAGLPAFLGSAGPEPVGSLDLIALGLEVGIVVGGILLARRAGLPQMLRSPRVVASSRGAGIALVAILVGVLVLWGSGGQAHDHEHDPPDAADRSVEITVPRDPDDAADTGEPAPSDPPGPTSEDSETHAHGDDRVHTHDAP